MMTISITGLDKAEVLMALYNRARPQRMGFLHYTPTPLAKEEAQQLLAGSNYFDYLNGRVMKVSLEGDELDPRLYDRDNGSGAAAEVIAELRKTGDVFSESSEIAHLEQRRTAAELARKSMDDPGGMTREEDGTVTFRLGLSDMKKTLGPIVDEVLED
jgi:hypothetical protein